MALEAELCDCDNTTRSDLLQFGDYDCETRDENATYEQVSYAVYTDKPVPKFVDGFACSTWLRRKIISTNFWNQQNFILQTVPIDTSAEHCRRLVETEKCGDFPMIKIGANKKAFSSDPLDGGKWDDVVIYDLLNCAIQKVNLSHPCENCQLYTPVGPADHSTRFVARAHVTVVWDAHSPKHEM